MVVEWWWSGGGVVMVVVAVVAVVAGNFGRGSIRESSTARPIGLSCTVT